MKVLFFSPHAGIIRHQEIEIALAGKFRGAGHSVKFIGCGGLLKSFCVTMSAFGLTETSGNEQKLNACVKCRELSTMNDIYFGFEVSRLENWILPEDSEHLEKILLGLSENNWWDFHYEGVPVGRLAGYEFLLNHKINTRVIPKELWNLFQLHVKNCLSVTIASIRINQQESFDLVISYNRLYATHRIFTFVSESFGRKSMSIQAAGSISNPYKFHSALAKDSEIFDLNVSPAWRVFNSNPLSARQVLNASKHLESLFKATSPWVYSTSATATPRKEIQNRIGSLDSQKVFLLTTSSQDEIFAALFTGVFNFDSTKTLFADNYEWINFVVSAIQDNPNWFLIIRPHPREFPNKREKVMSDSGQTLSLFLERFANYPRVFVNLPNQEISIYDLAKITDVHLNSTSTVGVEFALLGIPSILTGEDFLTAYPPEISNIPTSLEDYRSLMEKVSKGDLGVGQLSAIKWLWFRQRAVNHRVWRIGPHAHFWVSHNIRRLGNISPIVNPSGLRLLSICLKRVFNLLNQKPNPDHLLSSDQIVIKRKIYYWSDWQEKALISLHNKSIKRILK